MKKLARAIFLSSAAIGTNLSYARNLRKGFRRLGWQCAKVKGRVELKIHVDQAKRKDL